MKSVLKRQTAVWCAVIVVIGALFVTFRQNDRQENESVIALLAARSEIQAAISALGIDPVLESDSTFEQSIRAVRIHVPEGWTLFLNPHASDWRGVVDVRADGAKIIAAIVYNADARINSYVMLANGTHKVLQGVRDNKLTDYDGWIVRSSANK